MTTEKQLEDQLLLKKIKQVSEAINRFSEFKGKPWEQVEKIISLQADLRKEKVFIYKYEAACKVIRTVNLFIGTGEEE